MEQCFHSSHSRHQVIVITGNSMRPILRTGDVAVLDTSERRSPPKPGEIIALRHDLAGVPVLHRVIHADDYSVICMGDNCRAPDPPSPPSSVAGTLVLTFSRHRRLLLAPNPLVGRFYALVSRFSPCRPLTAAVFLLTEGLHWHRLTSMGTEATSTGFPEHLDVQEVGGELVVYDRRVDAVHVLNEQAASIWKAALAGLEESGILAILCREHPEVDAREVSQDLAGTLASLRQSQLI